MKISLAIVALLPLSSASVLRGYHTAVDENDDRKLLTEGDLPRRRRTDYTCPSSISSGYWKNEGIIPCITNADCVDPGDCCMYPQCICEPSNLGTGVVCLTDDRTDPTTSPPIITIPPVPTPVPTTPPTPPATPSPTPPATVVPNPPTSYKTQKPWTGTPQYCPSSTSYLYKGMFGKITCTKGSDCAGIIEFGYQTCCVYPLCLCGLADTSGSEHICAADPDPTTPAPTPAPTPPPVQTPAPTPWSCPTPMSPTYQNFPDVVPCTTNADCVGVKLPDGPVCCVSPYCICGYQSLGASGTAGCVLNRRDRELFEQVLGKDLP